MRRTGLALALAGLCGLSALAASPVARRARAPDACVLPPARGADGLTADGRYWHALRTLPADRLTRPLSPDSAVLRARIAEGLWRYAEVEALLRRARGADTVVEFQLLAARADERAERWREAERRYRRVLAGGELSNDLVRSAAPRLAFVLERAGQRDSAVTAWRRAAQAYPELSDWFAIRRAELERDTALAFAAVSAPRTPGALQRSQLFIAGRRMAAGNLAGALEVFQRYGKPLDVARVEYALGRTRQARARADSVLQRDPTNPYRPDPMLAATFLTERFDSLTLAENLLVSTVYRTRGERFSAERYARAAATAGARLRPDTSVEGWLALSRILAERRDVVHAMRAVDSAAIRARRRLGLIAAARAQVQILSDQWDLADTALAALVRTYPRDTSVARLLTQFADRHRAKAETEPERARYRILLARFPDAPATLVARFRTGLVLYQEGNRDSAYALLASAAERDSMRALGLGPRYWEARMRFERGDTAAVTALRAIATDNPIAFYGVRARETLGDTAFLSDATPPLPRPGSFPPARARERIQALSQLGFDLEARAEAVGWAGDSSASVYLLIAAAAAAGEAGFARESITLGEAARLRVGMVPGVARALFPYSFRGVIEAEAAEHCVDPLLLAALIRQESRFEPRVVSRVGARGLSQVMPATGKEIAERRRLGPWDPDLLFVPDFNLHLGARYVSDRMTRDTFPVYALLASYNAGPARVTRWKSWPEYNDTDLFAERVSISETRDYVRTVYASYVWYRYAWAQSPTAAERVPPAPLPQP